MEGCEVNSYWSGDHDHPTDLLQTSIEMQRFHVRVQVSSIYTQIYLQLFALPRSMFKSLICGWLVLTADLSSGIHTNGLVVFDFYSEGGTTWQTGEVMPCLQLWCSTHSHLQLWIPMRRVLLVRRHFNWQPRCVCSCLQAEFQTSSLYSGKLMWYWQQMCLTSLAFYTVTQHN